MSNFETGARARILGSAVALLTMLNAGPGAAQGLQDEKTIDAIVGTPITQEESRADADPARVMAAIDKSEENAAAVRKVAALSMVDIVFLADSTATDGGPPAEIAARLDERKTEIDALRKEVEGNAMLFHAIDSRQILLKDVLALEFDGKGAVTIFAAAKPSG